MKVRTDELLKGEFVCYRTKVIANDPTEVEIDSRLTILDLQKSTKMLGRGLVELCAGAGAMGHALEHVGAEVFAAIDHNTVVCEHLKLNHPERVIQAEIRNMEALFEAHQMAHAKNEPFTLLSGFPCQPFSSQGWMKAEDDSRFATFQDVVYAAHLMKPQLIMLECVSAASKCATIQSNLRELALMMGFEMKQYVFDLAWFWPMKRSRWYCVIGPKEWIENMANEISNPHESWTVQDVLGKFLNAAEHDMTELYLSGFELLCYQDDRLGGDERVLHLGSPCATVLHSYGNALQGCPCGCRGQGFAMASLVSKGLRGFYVIDEVGLKERFLHTEELAALMSVSKEMLFGLNQRTNLCLLGLIAAPIQVLRVFDEEV